MENLSEAIFEIRSRFDAALEAKSGWGKNELKTMHDDIVIQVLTEIASKK